MKLFILISIHIFLEYGEIQKPAVDSQRDMDVCHCGRFWCGPVLPLSSPPTLLPIGGDRRKILTRSMRFPHTPLTGNHSRAQKRRHKEDSQNLQMKHLRWLSLRRCWRACRYTLFTPSSQQKTPIKGSWLEQLLEIPLKFIFTWLKIRNTFGYLISTTDVTYVGLLFRMLQGFLPVV